MCTHLIWLVFSSWAELSGVFLVGWRSLKSTWSQCTKPAVRNCGHKHSAVQEPSLPSAHEIGPEARSGAAPKCPVLCVSRSPCAAPPGYGSRAGAGSSAPGRRAHASQCTACGGSLSPVEVSALWPVSLLLGSVLLLRLVGRGGTPLCSPAPAGF